MSADAPGRERLSAADIRAGYGAGDIIHGVSVAVAPGGVVLAIVGPNGSGKSTLLKALSGVVQALGGPGADRRPGHHRPAAGGGGAGRGGYVPQVDDVFAPLTVRENLEMGGYLLARREVGARVERVLGVFPRLGQMLTRRAGGLSGGERKMLAMGRVLMLDPAVFLLDEPTANLAPKVAGDAAVRARAERWPRPARRCSSSSSGLGRCWPSPSYAYVLGGGQVLMAGTPAQLTASQEFTESFFGAAPSGPR